MKPGPRTTPTVVKLNRGNPGKRPINQKEPIPKAPNDLPAAPDYIAQDLPAHKAWNEYGPRLLKTGVLTYVDLPNFEQFCFWYARWQEAMVMVRTGGTILNAGKGGTGGLFQNPYLAVARRSGEMMIKLGAEFGMTPSSRSAITVGDDGDDDDIFS